MVHVFPVASTNRRGPAAVETGGKTAMWWSATSLAARAAVFPSTDAISATPSVAPGARPAAAGDSGRRVAPRPKHAAARR